jgi:hypothetical protein
MPQILAPRKRITEHYWFQGKWTIYEVEDITIETLNEDPKWLGADNKSVLSHIRQIVRKLKSASRVATGEAGEDLNAHCGIILHSDGKFYHFNPTVPEHVGRLIGISTGEYENGEIATVTLPYSVHSGAGLSLTSGTKYYLTTGGVLTATPPAGHTCRAGYGLDAASLYISLYDEAIDSSRLQPIEQLFSNVSTVAVTHNLGRPVMVQVVGTDNKEIICEVDVSSNNIARANFDTLLSGKIIIF